MALIGIPNHYIVGIPSKVQRIEDWCKEHIGPYNVGWYWVHAYGDNLILRILNDDDAILFKLTFRKDIE